MVVLENSESYGSTLQSNYLDKYDAANDGASREEALYDVDCTTAPRARRRFTM